MYEHILFVKTINSLNFWGAANDYLMAGVPT
jgi:hypothetical protein